VGEPKSGWGLIRSLGRAAIFGVLLLRAAASPAQGAGGEAVISPAEDYGKLPLTFEASRGPWSGEVKFAARGNGYTVFLSPTEMVLALQSGQSAVDSRRLFPQSGISGPLPRTNVSGPRRMETRNWEIEKRQSKIENPKSEIANPLPPVILRMKLAGANPAAKVTGLDKLPGKSNYFIGNDPKQWRANVPNYARVKYEQILPGIDLVFYGNQRQLEFDFVIAPGVDPGAIRLAIETGNRKFEKRKSKLENPKTKICIDADGDLVISIDGSELRFHKPVVYQPEESRQLSVVSSQLQDETGAANPKSQIQNRKFMDAHYVLVANNEVRFKVSGYDKTRPLVIDPVMTYSTYLGGTGLDYANGIAVDAAGNAYVVGYTNSTDFPLSNPAQAAPGGGTCGSGLDIYPCFDVFVAKLNAAGTALVYSTYIGGSGEDYGMGIALDASTGSACVTGYTNSADFPLANPIQPSLGGGYDAFAVKLDPGGTALTYSTYLGGSGDDYAYGVALAPGGDALLAGFTSSADFPTTPGAVEGVYGGGPYDAFISRLDATGTLLVYATYLGGSGEDYAARVAIDAAGNATVTGYTNSADYPVAGASQGTYAGGVCGAEPSTFPCFDAFVTQLSAQGTALGYSTYLGGMGSDYGYGIAVDGDGNAFVAGLTTSTDFPVTAGAFQTAGGGASVDAFVTKLSPTGAAVYSTYLGGLGADAALDIAVDGAGNAYVTGYSFGGSFPLASPLQSATGSHYDAFLAKLNAAGTALVFSTYLGGSGQEKGHGVAVDPSGNAYITGGTFSTDFPVTAGAFQSGYAGGSFEGFVAKMANLRLPVVTPQETGFTFPDQGVATTSPAQAVSFANRGDSELIISGVAASGDFSQTNDCASPLAPGARCTLEITFSPTEMGPRFGSLAVEHSAWGSPFVVRLAGNGVAAPRLEISPAALSFGDQPNGTTSAPQTVTLSNDGQAVLSTSSIAVSDDFAVTHTCAQSVPVGDSCTLTVTFAPSAPGLIAGAVTIVDNAPGSPHVIGLAGTGLGAAVALSPTSLTFGEQLVETASQPLALAVTNSGNLPLEVASITTAGEFMQTNNCGGSVEAGAGCAIQVTFTPTAQGERTGALSISHNGYGSPATVNLSGTGVAPIINLSPSELLFGEQPVGTTSPPRTVTLNNSGSAPLNILGIEATGDFAQTNNCPGSVAVGTGCAITVIFSPVVAGPHAGTVAITHNPTSESFIATLSGMGTDFSISASPTAATVSAGETTAFSLTVTPIAGFSRQVSLTCSGAPKAAACSVAPDEVTVNGSGTGTAMVTITTTARSTVPPRGDGPEEFPPSSGDTLRLLWLSTMMFLTLAGWRSQRRRAWAGLGGVLLSAALWAACGGGGSASTPVVKQGTPAGTYPLTVSASSEGITRSATVTLRVN
jgi:hypothetical protein